VFFARNTNDRDELQGRRRGLRTSANAAEGASRWLAPRARSTGIHQAQRFSKPPFRIVIGPRLHSATELRSTAGFGVPSRRCTMPVATPRPAPVTKRALGADRATAAAPPVLGRMQGRNWPGCGPSNARWSWKSPDRPPTVTNRGPAISISRATSPINLQCYHVFLRCQSN